MVIRPAFNPYYTVHPLGDEGVVLLSEGGPQVLKGRMYCLLAPWIDGAHTTDDIVTGLQSDCSAAEVYYALNRLEQKGYIVDWGEPSHTPFDAHRVAFWKANDLDFAAAERRLRDATVAVRAVGNADATLCARAVGEIGLQVDSEADVDVVLTDDYLRPELEKINDASLAAKRPWLLAKIVGAELWLGPFFRPGTTGCWRCLAHRLSNNRDIARYLEHRLEMSDPIVVATASLRSTQAVGRQMVVTEIAKWIAAGKQSALEGKLVTVDTRTWRTDEHILTRRPQCPACGEELPPPNRVPDPLELQSCKKVYTADGGHRAVSPEETLNTYGHHISPLTGVVNMLHRPDESRRKDPLIHSYVSGHNLAVGRQCALDDFRRHFRSMSGGKGMTDAEAKAGALAEAIERYSAVFQPESDPRRPARYVDLEPECVHPYDHLLFSESQYRMREAWNAAGSRFNRVPEPFDEKAVVNWTPVWSLTAKRYKYMPTMSCYFAYLPASGERRFSHSCSNGNAAGNTLEEAIVQGFLELVERDAVAIWWYNRLRRAAVDLASFNEPYFLHLREHYFTLGRDLWVLDITSDLGVPTFAAVSCRTGAGGRQIIFGFGSHFDARIGVARALTEMNQMVGIAMLRAPADGAPDAHSDIDDPETVTWLKYATLENQRYMLPADNVPPKRADDYPKFESHDLWADVLRCQQLVENIGLEMMVLNLTRPDIGMPSVKVIVPGLRHFWARFAPGRLYDVPVAMGDLPRPLDEEELNPIPVFI